MIKSRNIFAKSPLQATTHVVGIHEGGLGTTSITEAIETLGTIRSTELGVDGGVPVLNNEGKVDIDNFASEGLIVPTVSGPSSMELAHSYTYTITNYDSLINYTVSINGGCTATFNKDTKSITVVTPDTYSNTVVKPTLVINGFKTELNLLLPLVSKPTLTNLVDGGHILVGNSITFSDFEISGTVVDSHSSTDIMIANNVWFNDPIVNITGRTLNKTSFNVDELDLDTTFYIKVRYRSTNGFISEWSDAVSFSVQNIYIVQPTITSPINGSTNVDFTTTVESSSFVVSSGSATHTGSDWQIATDSEFQTIVSSVNNSSTSLTSYKPAALGSNTTYYVRVRYLSTDVDNPSAWSDSVRFTTGEWVSDASGRKFKRHSSGMGTVMQWKNKSGTTFNTLVLDAVYRNRLPWANPSNYNFDLSGNTNYDYTKWYYIRTNSQTAPSSYADVYQASTASEFFGTSKTDAQINAMSSYFEDAGSSLSNTNAMMNNSNTSSTSYAAGWCRSKLVNGTKCNLPNIQTLIRIYLSQFKLDELDPSASDNIYRFTYSTDSGYKNWYFGGASYAWSSSETTNANFAWGVDYDSYCGYTSKSTSYAVVPVLEV